MKQKRIDIMRKTLNTYRGPNSTKEEHRLADVVDGCLNEIEQVQATVLGQVMACKGHYYL